MEGISFEYSGEIKHKFIYRMFDFWGLECPKNEKKVSKNVLTNGGLCGILSSFRATRKNDP